MVHLFQALLFCTNVLDHQRELLVILKEFLVLGLKLCYEGLLIGELANHAWAIIEFLQTAIGRP